MLLVDRKASDHLATNQRKRSAGPPTLAEGCVCRADVFLIAQATMKSDTSPIYNNLHNSRCTVARIGENTKQMDDFIYH
ncbi:hypothetical protein CEXT_196141 [Caerostris extrusa]|uniref:Uncharacterized protein n=1 Tax=Caerostris extrusa TaxID=172846 RepID=A0AAV4XDU5_CAEEX|nr:hypothetical protein CEXT_196141 [Caerostris extrusa]